MEQGCVTSLNRPFYHVNAKCKAIIWVLRWIIWVGLRYTCTSTLPFLIVIPNQIAQSDIGKTPLLWKSFYNYVDIPIRIGESKHTSYRILKLSSSSFCRGVLSTPFKWWCPPINSLLFFFIFLSPLFAFSMYMKISRHVFIMCFFLNLPHPLKLSLSFFIFFFKNLSSFSFIVSIVLANCFASPFSPCFGMVF